MKQVVTFNFHHLIIQCAICAFSAMYVQPTLAVCLLVVTKTLTYKIIQQYFHNNNIIMDACYTLHKQATSTSKI